MVSRLPHIAPPELKAIITVCSTDDRYADDIHHMGGCLLGDNLSWASTMFAYNSCPPDPLLVGERWKELWLERLQGSGFYGWTLGFVISVAMITGNMDQFVKTFRPLRVLYLR